MTKSVAGGPSRAVGGAVGKQEVGIRNRAALGELTNKDATANVGGEGKADKAKAGPSKAATSTVTGRPIIARRTTRNSLANADKPEVAPQPTAGPSRSTAATIARARPAVRARPSAKDVKEEINAGPVKREAGKATSATVMAARAGIKRTLTATSIQTQPTLSRAPSVKRELEEHDENLVLPSSKRVRTSSPVKREDVEDLEVETAVADVKALLPVRGPTDPVDALEDEQPYELEEDAVGMSGGRLGDMMIQDIDADDAGDPTMVVEYVQDIFNYMKDLEVRRLGESDVIAGFATDLFLPSLGFVDAKHGLHGTAASPQVGDEGSAYRLVDRSPPQIPSSSRDPLPRCQPGRSIPLCSRRVSRQTSTRRTHLSLHRRQVRRGHLPHRLQLLIHGRRRIHGRGNPLSREIRLDHPRIRLELPQPDALFAKGFQSRGIRYSDQDPRQILDGDLVC